MWACGAAGSALPWHGRGHRFDPDQVHQVTLPLSAICDEMISTALSLFGVNFRLTCIVSAWFHDQFANIIFLSIPKGCAVLREWNRSSS